MPDVKKIKLPRHVAIIMDGNGRWAKNAISRAYSATNRGRCTPVIS